MREPAVPLLSLALVAVCVSAALGKPADAVAWWPTAPTALGSAVALLLVAWVAIVLPSTRHATPVTVFEAICVSAPLCASILVTAAGPVAIPWTILSLAVGLAALACETRPPWRRWIVFAAASGFVGVPTLASAGILGEAAARTTLERLAPPTAPLATVDETAGLSRATAEDLLPSPWREPDALRPLRVGALARTPAPSAWPRGAPPWTGARWISVPDGAAAEWTRGVPVARFVGGGTLSRAALESLRNDLGVVPVPSAAASLVEADPRDLDAVDLVVLGGDAEDDEDSAAALLGFVRRGGLLVGPAKGKAWPTVLARRLGTLAVDEEGPFVARALDAGHVARAASPAALAALLAAGLHRPRVSSVFHRALAAPAAPSALCAPAAVPEVSATPIAIAVAATALLGVVAAITRGRRRTAWLVALAALGTVEPLLVTARDAGPSVEAAALEIGGVGARRLEVFCVSAGPSGWVFHDDPRAPTDGLSVFGFEVVRFDGAWHLALAPGASGWVVVDRVASGAIDDAVAVASPPTWALALLDQPPAPGVSGSVVLGSSTPGLRWKGVALPARVRTVALRLRGG